MEVIYTFCVTDRNEYSTKFLNLDVKIDAAKQANAEADDIKNKQKLTMSLLN